MTAHLLVHYLDDLRHDLAFTWTWQTWIGNVSAGVIISGFLALLYPPFRRRVLGWLEKGKDWVGGHFAGVHKKLDDQHREHIDLLKHQHEKAEREAERRHQEALDLARAHHAALIDKSDRQHKAHLAAIRRSRA